MKPPLPALLWLWPPVCAALLAGREFLRDLAAPAWPRLAEDPALWLAEGTGLFLLLAVPALLPPVASRRAALRQGLWLLAGIAGPLLFAAAVAARLAPADGAAWLRFAVVLCAGAGLVVALHRLVPGQGAPLLLLPALGGPGLAFFLREMVADRGPVPELGSLEALSLFAALDDAAAPSLRSGLPVWGMHAGAALVLGLTLLLLRGPGAEKSGT